MRLKVGFGLDEGTGETPNGNWGNYRFIYVYDYEIRPPWRAVDFFNEVWVSWSLGL